MKGDASTASRSDGSRPHKRAKLGPALSLERYAARSTSTYDKRTLKEKDWRTAAIASKYHKQKKKLLGQREGEEQPQVIASGAVATEQAVEQHEQQQHDGQPLPDLQHTSRKGAQQQKHQTQKRGKHGHKHRSSSLQQLAAKVQEEKEAREQERQERQRAAEEKKRRLAEQHKLRTQKSKQLFKKTSRGQPVMKTRIEGILAKLGMP